MTRRSMYRRGLPMLLTAVLSAVTVAVGAPASSATPTPPPANGESVKAAQAARSPRLASDIRQQAARGQYPRGLSVGDVKTWPSWTTFGPADFFGSIYLKDYTLRGVSEHLEVWVASGSDGISSGLDYPSGDCRNGLATTVTDEQIAYLIEAFETEIRPALQPVFPDPRPRDGKKAALPRWIPEIPSSAFRGDGDRTVVLIDNFREPTFTTPQMGGNTLGIMFPSFINMTDRNVLALRGTGWAWRLGDDPLPTTWTGDVCTTRVRRPNLIEQVLAHEYAHVVQASAGTFFDNVIQEPKWLTEGSAEWATTLTRWGDRIGLISCFLGHGTVTSEPSEFCPDGPQSSLTSWGDADTSLGDYGAGATFIDLLATRFGPSFVRDLVTRTDAHGVDKVERLAAERGSDEDMSDLVADWAIALAASRVIADGAAPTPTSPPLGRYELSSLPSLVEWSAPGAYDRPGIAPNGSDFVRLRDGSANWLGAGELTSLDLAVDPTIAGAWAIDDGTFHSGTGDGVSARMARQVALPAGVSTIDFSARWETEAGWDFGFVQVSVDGGTTWRSLATDATTSTHHPDALPDVIAALPGYTGSSGGWRPQRATLELDEPADVLVSFAYRSDHFVHGGGFWIDDVRVNGALIGDGTSLSGWAAFAPAVDRIEAALVSYADDHSVIGIAPIPLDSDLAAQLDVIDLQRMAAPGAETVAVVITHLQPDLSLSGAASYRLRVNGILQPGGSGPG